MYRKDNREVLTDTGAPVPEKIVFSGNGKRSIGVSDPGELTMIFSDPDLEEIKEVVDDGLGGRLTISDDFLAEADVGITVE